MSALGSPADLPVRDDLRGKQPYGAPQLPHVRAQLNVNENPYGPSPALVAALARAVAEAAPTLHRYPDREALALRGDLAAYLSARTGVALTTGQVWAANGSNEVLQQVLQAFGGPGRTALGFEPSYSMHPLLAAGTGTGWVSERREADFTLSAEAAVEAVERHRPDVVFVTTPNNPTGTATPLAVVEAVCGCAPGIVVVDEAYAEFGASPSAVRLLRHFPRLLVSRTMSKAFAMAGTRLGYLAAGPAVIDALRLVRLPYHLSALTQVAGRTALAHTDELLGSVAEVRRQRDRMVDGVGRLGLTVVPTDANFLLFGPFADAPAVWQQLLDRCVLVRDVSGGPGLAGWLRVNAGTEDETSLFLEALAQVVG
ncbi:MAG TPA: histidinol-phosphate transaminase [Mycobacteriales bacterium]|jgi:histidinol-phosphate aminotransferase|nr:histidinol-phosphate transaminase [Mycobacteriales bacterium]